MTWNLIEFSAEEIVKLSTDIEKSGYTFYSTLAVKVADARAKEVLQFLANEEGQHIKDFEALGAELAKEFVANENYAGEYKEYLDSLIESHIFNQADIEDKFNKITDAKSALEMALRFEKDSIMIFQSFLNVVGGKAQEVIGKLINEEIGHIKKLSQLKKQL
ncbi:rubrerythrin [Desulfofarcimen acetoxidans DSM 771]|jgi:rubrerythrin|uniref:Rubrerythrin n=1 Tax=Desulfofarcimen acetoxidans (strain ATCC 49208 / DSM 771 / KCTC 5769 / VKM B-1644 / 5575) TaxID=485916 RepID=C8VVW2_DESAS|nr:ferritin family protein [Desulfofarcimen acetoxidans]ACV64249.1 rubrerythrin [Desulfofarcimen acetoxidans DSM 771]